MIIHELTKNVDYYAEFQPAKFSSYELKFLNALNIDEVWYEYLNNEVEGYGFMIVRKGQSYDSFDLSHNSCHGATEHYTKFKGKTLDEVIAQYKPNKEYWQKVKHLFAEITLS